MLCMTILFFYKSANQRVRHQATQKVGCQSGDFACGHQSSSGVCVGIYMG